MEVGLGQDQISSARPGKTAAFQRCQAKCPENSWVVKMGTIAKSKRGSGDLRGKTSAHRGQGLRFPITTESAVLWRHGWFPAGWVCFWGGVVWPPWTTERTFITANPVTNVLIEAIQPNHCIVIRELCFQLENTGFWKSFNSETYYLNKNWNIIWFSRAPSISID